MTMYDKEVIYKRMRRYRMDGILAMDAPMDVETSFRIGGPADILFKPDNIAEVVRVVKLCRREGIALTVLGNGTNILVRDGGVRGIVMKLSELTELRREREHIFAGAGAGLTGVCEYAMSNGLSGLEFACGIPGSAGGAVCMNAGAYGAEMKDVVYRSVVMDAEGNIGLFDNSGHKFSYRTSAFQDSGYIVLETEFLLTPSEPGAIASAMDEYRARREASQPLDKPSAGSVFRRPAQEGVYVGPMIEACGLKGAAEGGARISEKHAGFIVNGGGATAADVINLIDRAKAAVKEKYGIDLKTEIRIIGDE
ncbi:MAG: UDP-N-acetylmuramate dehydrogenase [Oscillospiraceae bacterium]|nr:UDP-N-acetylmuramate dehydrogenase [Oscillospiraceae bacterium]